MLLRLFPVLPDWNGMHPVLVSFPIALLLAAPLLLVVSLILRKSWRSWATAALLLMALGTLAAWLAVSSGHAAGQLVDKSQALERVIGRHEELGMMTRNLYTALTLLLAFVVMLPGMLRRPLPEAARIAALAAFLLLYAAGTSWLTLTADAGGRLVHEFGVRAMVGAPTTVDSTAVAITRLPATPAPRAARLR
jgi:uncharacterized membrane protein